MTQRKEETNATNAANKDTFHDSVPKEVRDGRTKTSATTVTRLVILRGIALVLSALFR